VNAVLHTRYALDHFPLKQSQISDYARMRLAALKIYGIPVRVFTEPISGLFALTFGETPNSSA
jgi:hypothetical protein